MNLLQLSKVEYLSWTKNDDNLQTIYCKVHNIILLSKFIIHAQGVGKIISIFVHIIITTFILEYYGGL